MTPAVRILVAFARWSGACALAALAVLPLSHAAGTFRAKVLVVVDGDTVVVRDERARKYEIRLAGVDAPEIRQPYGVRSRTRLAELIYGKRVTVTWYKRDRYHRVLGHVWVDVHEGCGAAPCSRAIDAGYAQISAGLAWHDRQHLDEQGLEERVRYARAEQEARSRRAGLWAGAAPVPPWRYRHRHPRDYPPRTQ